MGSIDFPAPMADFLLQRPALIIETGDLSALGMLLGGDGDDEGAQRIKLFGLRHSPCAGESESDAVERHSSTSLNRHS